MSQYFPKPYKRSSGYTKVELDLSNYVARDDLTGATSFDTCNLAAKLNVS